MYSPSVFHTETCIVHLCGTLDWVLKRHRMVWLVLFLMQAWMPRLAPSRQNEALPPKAVLQVLGLPPGERLVALIPRRMDETVDEEGTPAGCLIVTSRGMYECRPRCPASQAFLQLLGGGADPERQAEDLGAALKLDVCSLYERAADELLAAGKQEQALHYFSLAQSPPAAVVARFSRLSLVAAVIPVLRQTLAGSTVNTTDRKRLSDLLMLCYAQQACLLPENADAVEGSARPDDSLREEEEQPAQVVSPAKMPTTDILVAARKFVYDSWDYTFSTAILALLRCGLLNLFFEAANARQMVAKALNMPVNRGRPALTPDVRHFLFKNGFVDAVCDSNTGLILRCMPAAEAIQFLVANPDAIARCIEHATPLLGTLDVESLIDLAKYFDPGRPAIRAIYNNSRRRLTVTTPGLFGDTIDDPHVTAGDVAEAFINVLLALGAARRKEGLDLTHPYLYVPWRVAPALAIDCAVNPSLEVFGADPSPSPTRGASTDDPDVGDVGDVTTEGLSSIACGMQHAALVVDGDAITWGRASGGRLGQGDIIEEQRHGSPARLEILHMNSIIVVSVACGAEHTIARCDAGLYAWGANSFGQLGLGDTRPRQKPVEVPGSQVAMAHTVVCGHYHTVAIVEGAVFVWGVRTLPISHSRAERTASLAWPACAMSSRQRRCARLRTTTSSRLLPARHTPRC
eukprot:m.103726 g.103726  ORF g.103726 m.103726 type:complete len:687 (+) comp8866_c0_seq1:1060-3120(+)